MRMSGPLTATRLMDMSLRTYRRIAAMTLAVIATTLLAAGCGSDAICGSDDYPVIQINGPGSACQSKGTDPSPGFARYPSGKEPKHVDDEWDVFWRNHTVNQAGDIVDSNSSAGVPSPSQK
jgi:hypothetical protein